MNTRYVRISAEMIADALSLLPGVTPGVALTKDTLAQDLFKALTLPVSDPKSRIPVVYVVGKFRSPTHWGMVQNIRAAEQVALSVWEAGAAAVTPHLNTANFEGALGDTKENASIWLDGDIQIMKRCDAVVLVHNWRDSSGSKAEIEIALAEKIPVFTSAGLFHEDHERGIQGWDRFKHWVSELRSGRA